MKISKIVDKLMSSSLKCWLGCFIPFLGILSPLLDVIDIFLLNFHAMKLKDEQEYQLHYISTWQVEKQSDVVHLT